MIILSFIFQEVMEFNGNLYKNENQILLIPESSEVKQSENFATIEKGKHSNLINFFLNEISLICPGEKTGKIDEILCNWKGDYRLLENHHGYIQWLFPNDVLGVNPYAPIMTKDDMKIIEHSGEIKTRFLSGFDLMLDFYGFRRKNSNFYFQDNWKSRIQNLHDNTHNFLRITRILLALNLFGFSELQFPFLQSLLKLVYFKDKPLGNAEGVTVDYWMKTMKLEDQNKMIDYLKNEGKEENQLELLQPNISNSCPKNCGSYRKYSILGLFLFTIILSLILFIVLKE
jgi:hypothetical protein